ncbi:thiol:disulfide interchange protein [Amylibacter kogurei]|uniref:Thiol:disulfide interchange protein n=1 Tax=Paramylibacter kogurei TaxID=1889778 RepID=A0A2G5K4Q2_9RHOB|nr:DsbE family thiol:disulfide interchange protein [Amylibacter kogurei]PIB23993.1 thiol:disulfide interchange protein [Amylibacter kogurei]
MKRILMTLPMVLVLILGAFLYWGLNPDRNPNEIPSPLLGKSVPDFTLAGIDGVDVGGFGSAELSSGGIKLVNVFASWCVPCRAEHGVLIKLAARENVQLYGINYKDKPTDAQQWLAEMGNPYAAVGSDFSGRVGIEWGVSGVPETFIVSPDGVILYHYRGPLVGDTALRDFGEGLRRAREQIGQS